MSLDITVYGVNPDELDDGEREALAHQVHSFLQEDLEKDAEAVGIDGYGDRDGTTLGL